MVYDLHAYWLVYPILLKTEGEKRGRARRDRCCLNCIILGSVMRYAPLLCVSARAVTMYVSFIEARPHKSFDLVVFSVVGLYLFFFFFSFSVCSSSHAGETTVSMSDADGKRRWDYSEATPMINDSAAA